MVLAYMGYAMIAILMGLIITKKTSPFAALMLVPIVFGTIISLMNGTNVLELGTYSKDSIKSMAGTFSLLLFAIIYFGLMIEAGLFDPLVRIILRIVGGDPLKVLVGTAILSAAVALDGDGTTTYLICCTAMVPVFDRLKMNKLYMAAIMLMQVTVMNMLPWGGPSARIIVVAKMTADELLRYLVPGMVLAVLYNIGLAYYLGLKERKRLGIISLESVERADDNTEEEQKYKRPKLVIFNLILTVLSITVLIAGWLPSNVTFGLATAIALVVNYPNLKDQKYIVDKCGAESIPVITLIMAAGVLMGVMEGVGISDAMATHLSTLIPESMSSLFPIITAVISCFGTFFLSNDAFYYGVLPVLAETGYAFGFSNATMGYASIMGQAFHLISPLVGSLYVITQLSEESMTSIQRFVAKYAIGIFICLGIGGMISGVFPS